jgi:hypothetical protein
MKYFAILLALLATSAYASQRVAKDYFHWGKPEFTNSKVQVEVIYVESRKELLELLIAKGGSNEKRDGESKPPKLNAFSIVRKNKATCTIYTLNPKVEYKPEFLGHEMFHCLHGRWHD